VFAHAAADGLHDMTIVGHELGESLGQLGMIELAQALDDGVFGREAAVEIAGARADFVGHMLHRRCMEPMTDESVLGRLQDSLASLGVSGPTSY
jgi:hypothetical protein